MALITRISAGQQPVELGQLELGRKSSLYSVDKTGSWLAFSRENEVHVISLRGRGFPERAVRAQTQPITGIDIEGGRAAASDSNGEIQVWPVDPESSEKELTLSAPGLERIDVEPSGRRLAVYSTEGSQEPRVGLRNLDAPPEAAWWFFPSSLSFPNKDTYEFYSAVFEPAGRWLATCNHNCVVFWPIEKLPPLVLRSRSVALKPQFTPDGRDLVWGVGTEVRMWRIHSDQPSRVVARGRDGLWLEPALDGSGYLLAVPRMGGPLVVDLRTGTSQALAGFGPDTSPATIAIDSTGKSVAAAAFWASPHDKVIRVWNLETGEMKSLGPAEDAGPGLEGGYSGLRFLPDGRLMSNGDSGLRLWTPGTGEHKFIAPAQRDTDFATFAGGQCIACIQGDLRARLLAIVDVETRTASYLQSHGNRVQCVAVNAAGSIVVSGDDSGIIRVGPITGEEPHVLLGHKGGVNGLAVSPDGTWIVSSGLDNTIRLWPMPDLSKPPLHTLPHNELLVKLKSFTNLRAVRDPASDTGWKLELGPFPGWETVPEY